MKCQLWWPTANCHDTFDAVISSQNCRLQCHCKAMFTTPWKTGLDRLDELDSAIPRLSKEDMKDPISWDLSAVEYTWPTMPCVAATQIEMNSGFVQPVEISIARARGADLAFLEDIQLTLQWCCYLWNQEEAPQSWGSSWNLEQYVPVSLACTSVNVISTYSKCSQRNQQLVHHPSFMQNKSMMQATGKSALKIQLHVEISQHLSIPPAAAVLDVSAVLWTVTWPVHASVDTFIQTFKAWLAIQPQVCDIHLCFDLHFDYWKK